MKRGKKMQLSWTMFETQCMDSRGIKLKFEGLCRQLFMIFFPVIISIFTLPGMQGTAVDR